MGQRYLLELTVSVEVTDELALREHVFHEARERQQRSPTHADEAGVGAEAVSDSLRSALGSLMSPRHSAPGVVLMGTTIGPLRAVQDDGSPGAAPDFG